MRLKDIKLTELSDKGAVMTVVHPTKEEPMLDDRGEPMTIRLVGADSSQFRAASARIANREIKKRKANRTVEKSEANAIELLAACTIDWSIQVEDEPEPFSRENAEIVYREHPWLREQVDIFVGDRANFLEDA